MALTPVQEALKQAYIKARGYWVDWTEGILRFSPGFLDLYARYGGHPAAAGPLSPLMCELIYVALDASSTHLFESGLVLHMRYAMRHGATAAQVMEVLAMATAQGLGGTRVGIDILAEELAAAGKPVGGFSPVQAMARKSAASRAAVAEQASVQPALCGRSPWSTVRIRRGRSAARVQRAAARARARESPPPDSATATGRELSRERRRSRTAPTAAARSGGLSGLAAPRRTSPAA